MTLVRARRAVTLAVLVPMGLVCAANLTLPAHHHYDEAFVGSAAAAGEYGVPIYLPAERSDLAGILGPPPAPDSDTQKADLAAVLTAQRDRTSEQSARAVADNQLSVSRFADVLGPNFIPDRLPKTSALFRRIHDDSRIVALTSKGAWNRPRPFTVSPDVKAIGELPKSGSYPSGHATFGYLAGIILAQMVPERAPELFERGREYGTNRVLAGVHFPSDVEAGRIAASIVAVEMMANPTFRFELKEATSELRNALGIEPARP